MNLLQSCFALVAARLVTTLCRVMYARAAEFWQLLHEVVRLTCHGKTRHEKTQVVKLFWWV